MAYLDSAKQFLLFGGGNGLNLGDTWLMDGSDWHQLQVSFGPPARSYATAVHHSQQQKAVMYGGLSYKGAFTDTWAMDGKGWAQVDSGEQAPAAVFSPIWPQAKGIAVILDQGKPAEGQRPTAAEAEIWILE